MALGDVRLTFSLTLSSAVKVSDATTGTVTAGPTTGTVSS